MRLKMISNLIVLISFSALVSLGVCKPLDLPINSKQLYAKCLPQGNRFQTFISCKQELKKINFTSDALNYVCLLSLNVILEACKYDGLLPKIKENFSVKPINQTCPIIYVAKYDNLKYDLHEGINYLRDRAHCEALCSYSEDSLIKCNFLKEVIEVVSEYHKYDKSSQGKIPAVHDSVSAEKKMYEDIRNPDNMSPIHVDKDLKNGTSKDLSQEKIPSDTIGSSNTPINQANKTENTNKMNNSKANADILYSSIDTKVDDNKKDNSNIDENKFSNNEKSSGPKLLDDSVRENENSYKLPGKDDEQGTMSVSNPIDANTDTMQTESGSFGELNKNINVNNHEKDYRNDGGLADEGGGGDDDDDISDPVAVAAAVANSANTANNNNNNDIGNNNNINEDEDMEKAGMQDALPDREPPQHSKSLNSKEIYSSDNFFQAEDSHFSTYFLMTISLIIIGYIIYHNKNKIVAYALEGRRNRNGRRRATSSASYRKLDCNLEEAIASNPSHASVTNVVY